MRLAQEAAEAFGLDRSFLCEGRPDRSALLAQVPYDTSIAATCTAAALDAALPSVRELLAELRHEAETGSLAMAAA